MTVRTFRPESSKPRRRAVYLAHAALHPCQLLLCAYLPLAALFGMLVPALTTFVITEIVLLGMLPNSRAFRRRVDERLYAAACATARKERAQLLAQMTDVHREELERIEVLADALRERVTPSARAAAPLEECLGIDRLLAMYVHGAIAFCAGRVCLAMASRDRIRSDIQHLSEAVAAAKNPSARALASSRLDVARMRAMRWQRSYEQLELIQGQLSLIADLVRLMYEQSAAPIPSEVLAEEINRALASAQESQRTVHELAELLAEGVVPDPAVLRLGRQVLPESRAPICAVIPAAPQSGLRVVAGGTRVAPELTSPELQLDVAYGESTARAMRVR